MDSHSSSSSSSMDDASMDDSDREHSYDYEIEEDGEGDEPDAHDDYEDVPDDEDEEEDDEDDEDDDAIYVEPHPRAPPISISDSLANFSSTLSELRRARDELPIFSRPLSAGPSSGPLALDQLLADSPLLNFPSRLTEGSAHDRHFLRSVFLDTFDSVAPSNSRHAHHSFYRGSDSLASLTARLRGGLSAALNPRLVFSGDDSSAPQSALHPMLLRPRSAQPVEAIDGNSILNSIRRSATVPNIGTVVEVDPDDLVSASLAAPEAPESRDMGMILSECFDNIRATIDVLDEGIAEAGSANAADGHNQASDGAQSTIFLPQQHGAAGPSSAGGQASGVASAAMGDREAGVDVSGPAQDDVGQPEDRDERRALRVLREHDLARSVEPGVASSGLENMLGMLPRRGNFERVAVRDRDREKIHSSVQKRWSYEPPSCGGDSLPTIFDTDMLQRNNRSNNRGFASIAAMPVIAPQTHESVNQLGAKIISRLDSLFTDMMKIDMKVSEQERKQKAKKEAEEKKKADAKKESKDMEDGKPGSSKSNEGNDEDKEDTEEVDGRMALSTDRPVEEPPELPAENWVDTQRDDEPRPISASQGEGGDEGNASQLLASIVASIEADDDAVMDTGNNEQSAAEGAVAGNVVPEETANADTAADTATAAEAPAATDFAAVAVQRAAAAGISLDAPANENPEVVAAATQSTGIDPAFLAALPEEMRTEILTQYYEQIRTNTGNEPGAPTSAQATTVNQDFLIALPPSLRAEVLELEAEFQSRQNDNTTAGDEDGPGESQGGGQGSPTMAAAEMDNATFLATLAPELREEVLLTSGEAFIQSLPPNVAAEARALRDRETRSRLPWRVGSEFPVGFDGRRFPNHARARVIGGNRGPRVQPREAPVYRWKKVGSKWLREVPKAADEPKASLEEDGISSLMQLVWRRQENYGKKLLYQVFSHACKNSPSRLLVLGQLLEVITASQGGLDSQMDTKKTFAVDRSRQQGAAVRRALDLLTLLCKNDPVVAETLLGLPRTEEDLESVPTTVSEDTVMPQGSSSISLSHLVSLLDTPLFVRSNSHLEQLVSLISVLCQALPDTLDDESDRRQDGRLSHRRNPFSDHMGSISPEFQETMNFVLFDTDGDGDGDPHTVFHVQEDGGDEDDDESEEDPYEESMSRMERDPISRRDASPGESKADLDKVVGIPPQYRIPGFHHKDLIAFTQVLLRQGCSERTYDRVSRSIGILGELVPIRITFVESLVRIAVASGKDIHKEYEGFIAGIEKSSHAKSPIKRADVVSSFSVASASDELTLLRVVKSLSALWGHEAEEIAAGTKEGEKEKEGGEKSGDNGEEDNKLNREDTKTSDTLPEQQIMSTERRFRPSMLSGLQSLWNALDRLLELVADEAGLKAKKGTGASKGQTPTSVLNVDRIRSPNKSLSPVLARLSPMIEAFLVTHSVDEPRLQQSRPSSQPATPGTPSLRPPPAFDLQPLSLSERSLDMEGNGLTKGVDGQLAAFVERHRGPINALLRTNPSLLETSFKGALKHPHAIDFDNKKAYFRNVIRRRSSEAHAGTIRLNVRRDRVLEDSYYQLRGKTADEMKGRLHVQFNGEEGVDAGGVTREWYIILARQIFDPNYVLFTRSAAKAATYQPDKRSYINSEHLQNFKFVGRVIGKAIYDGQLLDAYFTRSFYKHILGLKPTYHDIEAQDPEYYKSLKWMLENDITGILDYTMSAEYDEFGKQTVIDLMPNGRNIAVTEENKADFVRLVTEVRMTKAIEKQIEGFKEGFYELIPYEDCKIFNELELELLMSGLPDIDMADLKANVEYTGYTASSPQVNWFWRCVGKMDQEDLARLVMFVTGTSKVPLEGFSSLQGMNGVQKFQIHRVAGDTLRLPSAHTCFNQLDLPEYGTAEVLSERLLRAVRECNVGFGFA